MKRSGSGVHFFELAFEHTVDILNTDWVCLRLAIRTDAHLTVNHACAYSGHLMLLSDLTKLAVAVADVDRFCSNLVTCLQFNVSVLA